ncbi:MAG: PQQ-binding-like beta-propeller repeat protein [Candidatus Eisenbacteria bacterium]|uniref:PQQ-binding-like beta-propeller repeat protein n=1 Tax=Eiseniibacteriota bacterium TaxID=2212470 RepID=A0A7Y2E7Q9_UNCEI|nr:PQQ-binding-like beta-propeller repeat protein [Candidatus Eisenbacteria bacterium]
MPLQPRFHTVRPDKNSSWFSFFELTGLAERPAHFLVVGPTGDRTREKIEGALAAGQAAVRFLKETPKSAPSETLLQGVEQLLDEASKEHPLEFGCGMVEGDQVRILTRGRVRLVSVAPKLGRFLTADEATLYAIDSQIRYFFGRLPEAVEDRIQEPGFAGRLETEGGGDGGLVLSFALVESIKEVAKSWRPNRPTTVAPPVPVSIEKARSETKGELTVEQLEIPTPTSEPSADSVTSFLKESLSEAVGEDQAEDQASTKESGEKEDATVTDSGTEAVEPPVAEKPPAPEVISKPEVPATPERESAPEPEVDRPRIVHPPEQKPAQVDPSEGALPEEALPEEGPLPESVTIADEVDSKEPQSKSFAPEETRGLGFWSALVTFGLTVSLLAVYLIWLRPGGSEEPQAEDVADPDPVATSQDGPSMGWSQKFESAVTSSPTLAGSSIVFGCRDGKVYALTPEAGERVWAFASNQGFGSSPVATDSLVIIGGYDGLIYGLNIETGKEAWSVPTKGRIVASPATEGDLVFLGSYDNNLYAVTTDSGELRWQKDLGAVLWASPTVSEGTVFVAGLDGVVTALAAPTGNILWQVDVGGEIYASPVVGGRKVFVGAEDKNLYAFDVDSGELLWQVLAPAPINGTPTFDEGRVFVGAEDGTLLAIDASLGKTIWSAPGDGAIKSRPAVQGNEVWITSYEGAVRGYEKSTGTLLGTLDVGTPAFSSPLLAHGHAYFGGMDGRFFAIKLSGNAP